MNCVEKERHKKCIKCKEDISYKNSETFWDENGFGYSTKLIKCKNCNCINVIKHIQDKSMELNNDKRYYKYL